MKYKINKKIKSFSAVNDWQGLGKEIAELLESGKEIELKNAPKHLVKGNYLVEAKSKESK